MTTTFFCTDNFFLMQPRGLPVGKQSAENHQFPSAKRKMAVPCVLVAGRKRSICVDVLLQFFLFGPSAVAKLWIKTQTVSASFILHYTTYHFADALYDLYLTR